MTKLYHASSVSGIGTLKGMADVDAAEDSPFAIPLPDVPSRASDGIGTSDGSHYN